MKQYLKNLVSFEALRFAFSLTSRIVLFQYWSYHWLQQEKPAFYAVAWLRHVVISLAESMLQIKALDRRLNIGQLLKHPSACGVLADFSQFTPARAGSMR